MNLDCHWGGGTRLTRFLHATRSARSLHISFKLSPARSFSMRHGPLAPSTSHSSSVLPVLSPCDTVRSLPPHLIQAQSCPFFLHATRSARSLHISFKLSPARSFALSNHFLAGLLRDILLCQSTSGNRRGCIQLSNFLMFLCEHI